MHNHFNDDFPNLGICTIIKNNPTLSLMIILVGTNDVGKMGISERYDGVTLIVESIADLYKRALSCADEEISFRILALGIPGSAWQEKMPVAAEMVANINKSLRDKSSRVSMIDYVEFPFSYESPNNESIWGEDGLHLSKNGYEMLGKELAIDVKSILDTMD
jgi:lysophospholipase L1-like esterase